MAKLIEHDVECVNGTGQKAGEGAVEGDAFERDGITYLTIDRVINDEGIVNLTADEYGIQPFGE